MNDVDKTILKRAMRQAVKLTKVGSEDTDKDVLGKIFNHFHQSLYGYTAESWELSRKIPRRMKSFHSYSDDIAKYVSKLLSTALTEVNRINKNNEFTVLKNSLYSMRAMVNEAARVNEKSERVLRSLSEIERNIDNG